jgi:hypothetical protein
MTIQEKAAEISKMFVEKTRDDGSKFWSTDSEDEAIRDMCHDAHGEMLPNDWKYRFIVDALDLIAEADDVDDVTIEPDVYTADLTAWLASHNGRIEYLTRAIEEYEPKDGFTALSIAQSIEREEVFYDVLSSIRAMVEEE